MKRLYWILGSLTVLAIVIYNIVPRQEFEEILYPMSESEIVFSYDDRSDGGQSIAGLSMIDSALIFQCELKEKEGAPTWCGVIWDMDPEKKRMFHNWTLVDSLVLDVKTHNIKELLIKIWTYDPDVTNIDSLKSYRPLIKEIPLKGGREHISIPMEYFYVPKYWLKDEKVNTNLIQRHQEAVARVEILPGWNQKRNQFFIAFHQIKVIGISNMAYGILLFFMLIIVSIALGYRHKIHENKK